VTSPHRPHAHAADRAAREPLVSPDRPRVWPPRGDHAERARVTPAGMRRLGHCAAGPGQQCWATGWKAGPVLCNDFLIFNFCLIFQKFVYTSKMRRKYNTTQKNMRQISVYSLRATLHRN
jgi:hypothetical protein